MIRLQLFLIFELIQSRPKTMPRQYAAVSFANAESRKDPPEHIVG